MTDGGFQEYLDSQRAEGNYESEGAFTVDFAEAAERLSTFRLPSENHYLLKTIQLASRLGAETVGVKLESFRTSVHFRAPVATGVNNLETITRGFLAPLEVNEPSLSDLVAALWGSLGVTTLEVAWSVSEGYQGRRIFIKDFKFRAEDFQIERPLAEGELRCAFTLSVLRRKTWRFWLASRRNAGAYKLLQTECALSRVKVKVDSRPLERAPGSYFAKHRQETPALGMPTIGEPYHTALYELIEGNAGFEIGRPSLSRYLVRDRHYNVWASGTRVRNVLRPDGISSPAWMLQFRFEGKELAMRSVTKQIRCQLLLAYDEEQAKAEVPLRLTIVRQSVLMQRAAPQDPVYDPKPWFGCHLILDDDTLGTDLTGFQIIEDERLARLLENLAPRVELAKAFLEKGRALITGL